MPNKKVAKEWLELARRNQQTNILIKRILKETEI